MAQTKKVGINTSKTYSLPCKFAERAKKAMIEIFHEKPVNSDLSKTLWINTEFCGLGCKRYRWQWHTFEHPLGSHTALLLEYRATLAHAAQFSCLNDASGYSTLSVILTLSKSRINVLRGSLTVKVAADASKYALCYSIFIISVIH